MPENAEGHSIAPGQGNLSFNTRIESQPSMRISLRVPAYTAYLDDGSSVDVDGKDHIVELKNVDGYLMFNLLADLRNKTSWGTCQEATFWYWDTEKMGLQVVATDDELSMVFHKFHSKKLVSFVVEFPIKPSYKISTTLEAKLDKLPVRRNPNMALTTSSSDESDEESGDDIKENVDPSWMEDNDIFMEDHEVFVSLGLRAEDEAATMNLGNDGVDLNTTEISVDDYAENEPRFVVDSENPKIRKGETFPTMERFRMALKQYAILNEFVVHKVRTDKKRYRAECKANGCPWRIVANKLVGQPTVEITMIPHEHECMGTGSLVNTMASKRWVAEGVVSWLRKKPGLGAADLQDKLLEKYGVEVSYATTWNGRQLAMDSIYGSWEDSFQTLFSFRAALLHRSPDTIFEIATKPSGDGVMFDKLFLAMRPCVDGFLQGCRPYLGIDSTALNGRYKGQLASATALDGNNWMYPVAWAIFESESSDNWKWFMRQLVGHPPSLAISTDACKGLDAAVKEVFPGIEHRECMRHLWANFKKYFRGEVYDKNMWPAARAYKSNKFEFHWNQVVAADPKVVTYMNQHHNHKWSRSMFSNDVKCDYVNNNLSESFNSWIKKIKDLPLVDLINMLRRMTMDLWEKRRRIGSKLSGIILPTIIKQLKAKTRGLGQMKVHNLHFTAEVFGFHHDMTPWGHVVDLTTQTCTCGEWEMTGKPCPHALAFIKMFSEIDMATFVHEYYSVERFRTAYGGSIPHMTDKSQWPQVDMGFKLLPPPLKRKSGRQRKNRFKASHEPGAKKQQRCNKCGEFGHRETGNCPLNEPKKRKRPPQERRKPKRPKIITADTISPGSLTRRIVNLVHGDEDIGTSSSTISAKRLLVLSQDQGDESAPK
ncbi:Unknown protein [Striga hermonthica]|uniref:SWIM-type domain-containing protein n=1 Tax=Striga hermonthica TaxID=68872 RepID=A0A9N7P1K3_STRHE|nr:Unknown protein [Striga hermonthica]